MAAHVIEQMNNRSVPSVGLTVGRSVSRSICLSAFGIVAKRLSGSGCRWGWWVGSGFVLVC